jgi:hypothetical protein
LLAKAELLHSDHITKLTNQKKHTGVGKREEGCCYRAFTPFYGFWEGHKCPEIFTRFPGYTAGKLISCGALWAILGKFHFILNNPDVIPANLLSGNLAVNALSKRFPIKTFGNDN